MSENYWQRIKENQVNRRNFLKVGAATGVGLGAFSLVGCGDDSDESSDSGSGSGKGLLTKMSKSAVKLVTFLRLKIRTVRIKMYFLL